MAALDFDFEQYSLDDRILGEMPIRMEPLYSDDILTGAGFNDPALVAMAPQRPEDGPWDTFHNIMGAIGSIGSTARDLGTVIGTAERDIKSATGEYQTARQNALQGNKLGQWWDYAPMTEKVMVIIGVAGLGLVVWQIAKD
jgi:hypothetical protein